jgi:1,2-diacylglycerol 3-beta-glucosyltransferase
MPVVNVTWLSWIIFGVVGYYVLLLVVAAVRRLARLWRQWQKRGAINRRGPFIVLVIPAHNEEAVIGQTLTTLNALDYPDRLVLVMDDGSTDATAAVALHWKTINLFTASGWVDVVRRDSGIAGQGKGAVLNHAFALVCRMVANGDRRLQGRSADEVVIGVMDADGQLESDALKKVAPYFSSRKNVRVGGVQIGVRIANATANLLARMQDVEFAGVCALMQDSRNSFNSVGLGGNGQFTRLSALQDLHRNPWTACLTEDLDLSLSLTQAGWEIRYCPDTFVAQQGVTRLWPFLRQRTRWIQGTYQCWRHLLPIWSNRKISWRTKFDLSVSLMMGMLVLVVSVGTAISLLGWLGVLNPVNTALAAISNPYLHNLVQLTLAIGPITAFIAVYQLRAATPLRWWELPAATVLFGVYGYLFLFSQIWAWSRIVMRHGSWAKTPRVRAEIAVAVAS